MRAPDCMLAALPASLRSARLSSPGQTASAATRVARALDAAGAARAPRVSGRRRARGPRPRHPRRDDRPPSTSRPSSSASASSRPATAAPTSSACRSSRSRPSRPWRWPAPSADAARLEEGLRHVVHAKRLAGERHAAMWYSWATASWRPEYGWNDYAGRGREGQDRVVLVNDPGPAGLDHLPRQDPHLLRPVDLQDRGGPAPGRRRHPHGPHHRERHLSLDHGAVGLGGPAGAARDAAELPAGGRLAAAGRGRAPVPAGRPGSGRADRGRGAAGFQGGAARSSSSTPRSGAPIRRSETEQRARPVAGPGPARPRGGADRRPLRPLRHRRAGERRLDLQRRRGQRVGHGRGDGRGRGVRPERRPRRRARSCSSGSRRRSRACSAPRRWPTHPPFPLRDMAAILNLDVLNLYGRTRDFSALGLDQSSLGQAISQAAAAEGLQGHSQRGGAAHGRLLPVRPLLAGAGRACRGRAWRAGPTSSGRPAGWGKEQKDLYIDEAVPPAQRPGPALVQLRRRNATASRHRQDSSGWSANAAEPAQLECRLRVPPGGGGAARLPRPGSPRAAEVMARRPTARGRPTYLPGRLRPAPLPRSVSGTAQPAPDSAHLAARERRAVDPVPHAHRAGARRGTPPRRSSRPPTWPWSNPRPRWRS